LPSELCCPKIYEPTIFLPVVSAIQTPASV
jgi:hypothetical protein